jgi:hypothetical protein
VTLAALFDVTPILMFIALGVLVRVTGLINRQSGLVLTRLAYYVTIPAAIFTSIARSQLTASMLFLPAIGFVLPTLLAGLAYLFTWRIADRPELRGVMMVAMVVLGVFGYPFFQLFFGEKGLARMAMYDVGNSLYAGTLALWLAQSFGTRAGARGNGRLAWRKVMASPVLWAAVLGVLASVLKVPVKGPVGNFLDRLAAANTPLAMIAVGVFVRPKATYVSLMAQFVLLRMVLGAILGWLFALALGMHGLDVVTACAASALPCGTTALIYAGNEGLDAEFAASLISVTVIIGAVLINVLPHLLARVYL